MKRINALKKIPPKNAFARGVSTLVSGAAGAQMLLVLASPLLTRLYTPDDFGVLAVYAGVLSIITVFGCLRYEIAIPLPKSDIAAYNIMAICAIILIFFTLVISFIIFLWGGALFELMNVSALESFSWLIPAGLLFTGLYSIFNYWAIRKKRFKDVTLTKLQQSFAMVLIQIIFYKFGAAVLIFGQAVGKSAGLMRLIKTIDLSDAISSVRSNRLRKLAIRYKNFPLFSTWTGIFNTVGSQLPPLIFAAAFSSGVAGLYALAHRVVAMPASIIGKAVADVFLSSAPQARRDGNLDNLLFKVVLVLALMAFPAGIFMATNAEILFSWVFGESWREAGIYAAILIPMLLMSFVTSPVTTLCAVLDKQFAGTIFQFLMMAVRIVSIGFGIYSSDPLLALILFSISSACCYLAFLLWLTSASGGSPVNMLGLLCQVTMISMLVLLAVHGFDYLEIFVESNTLSNFFISILAMFFAYFLNYRVWRHYVKAFHEI